LWKDVLLIPPDWYPEHKPRYETQGWWYVPAEEILGRECKSCRAFHELAEYVGTKRRKEGRGQCRNCQSKESQTDAPSTRRKRKKAAYDRAAVMNGEGTPRRSERLQVSNLVHLLDEITTKLTLQNWMPVRPPASGEASQTF